MKKGLDRVFPSCYISIPEPNPNPKGYAMKTIATLPDSHFLALSKLFASLARKDDRRDSIAEGDTETIAGTLEYSLVMTAGMDSPDAVLAMRVPTWDILAAALGRLNGVTIDALVREVTEGTIAKDDVKAAKETVTAAFTAIKGEARGMKRGPIKVADVLLND